MSWYRHWLVWGAVGGGTGYLVGSQKYFKLKHEAIITTLVGAITGATTAALINKFTKPKVFTPPPTVTPQIPQGTPETSSTPTVEGPTQYTSQSNKSMKDVDVEQADPIPFEMDDELQGSSIMDESMLSWDEDET